MSKDKKAKVRETAELIVELAKEVEAAGHSSLDDATLDRARTVLLHWIAGMKGIVVNPAFGRVTLIHENGDASAISSADLAYKMSAAGIQ